MKAPPASVDHLVSKREQPWAAPLGPYAITLGIKLASAWQVERYPVLYDRHSLKLISAFSFDDADRADSVELVYLFDEALDVMRGHLRQQHVDLFARSVGRDEKPLDLPGADAKRLLEQFGSQRAVCSLDLETATLIARPVSLLDRLDAGQDHDDDGREMPAAK
jgi:hypothetical protein